jgi:hypothetical protein
MDSHNNMFCKIWFISWQTVYQVYCEKERRCCTVSGVHQTFSFGTDVIINCSSQSIMLSRKTMKFITWNGSLTKCIACMWLTKNPKQTIVRENACPWSFRWNVKSAKNAVSFIKCYISTCCVAYYKILASHFTTTSNHPHTHTHTHSTEKDTYKGLKIITTQYRHFVWCTDRTWGSPLRNTKAC